MKTIFYILMTLFMTASFTACTADSIAEEDIALEEVGTGNGGNGGVDPDQDSGGGN